MCSKFMCLILALETIIPASALALSYHYLEQKIRETHLGYLSAWQRFGGARTKCPDHCPLAFKFASETSQQRWNTLGRLQRTPKGGRCTYFSPREVQVALRIPPSKRPQNLQELSVV